VVEEEEEEEEEMDITIKEVEEEEVVGEDIINHPLLHLRLLLPLDLMIILITEGER